MVHGSDKDKCSPPGVAGEPTVSLIRPVVGIASLPEPLDCPNSVQAAAGVVLTGVGYYSLLKSDRDPNTLHETADHTTAAPIVPDQKEVVRALDDEAQNSSNKYWGIKKT